MQKHRVDFLDGLRGLSIVLVILFHYLGPIRQDIHPYSPGYIDPLAHWGWSGVEMFFLISGFVIFMTIERCDNLLIFIFKRWVRLFPSMLIATILIFAFINLSAIKLASYSTGSVVDVIPGLTFISPAFYHALFHVKIESLDPVFWTLYTEVAFYLLFAVMYFAAGWRFAIAGLLAIAIITLVGPSLLASMHLPGILIRSLEPLQWVRMDLLGWFASGALFFKAHQMRSDSLFCVALLIGIASALLQGGHVLAWQDHTVLLMIVALFAGAQKSIELQKLFATPPMKFMGYISYPLYLIHNTIGNSTLGWAGRSFPNAQPILVISVVVAAVITAAYVITRWIEPATKRLIELSLPWARA